MAEEFLIHNRVNGVKQRFPEEIIVKIFLCLCGAICVSVGNAKVSG